MVLHIVLYEPEIPPNTGNVIRLSANCGFQLHLVGKLGFDLDDARLRRAGLDYHEFAAVERHDGWDAFIECVRPAAVRLFSTRCGHRYDQCRYQAGDALVFGPETRGLPAALVEEAGQVNCYRLPMRPGNRSLNLSNCVAVVAYEAWRQLGFPGGQ